MGTHRKGEKNRRVIFDYIVNNGLSPSEIAKKLGKDIHNVYYYLKKLEEEGFIIKKSTCKEGLLFDSDNNPVRGCAIPYDSWELGPNGAHMLNILEETRGGGSDTRNDNTIVPPESIQFRIHGDQYKFKVLKKGKLNGLWKKRKSPDGTTQRWTLSLKDGSMMYIRGGEGGNSSLSVWPRLPNDGYIYGDAVPGIEEYRKRQAQDLVNMVSREYGFQVGLLEVSKEPDAGIDIDDDELYKELKSSNLKWESELIMVDDSDRKTKEPGRVEADFKGSRGVQMAGFIGTLNRRIPELGKQHNNLSKRVSANEDRTARQYLELQNEVQGLRDDVENLHMKMDSIASAVEASIQCERALFRLLSETHAATLVEEKQEDNKERGEPDGIAYA